MKKYKQTIALIIYKNESLFTINLIDNFILRASSIIYIFFYSLFR